MIEYRHPNQLSYLNDPAAVDVVLAERKTLAGIAAWTFDERGSVARLTAPLSTRGVVGGLVIRAASVLHEVVQTGSCVLILDGMPIQRISFRPSHAHVNPFGPEVSARLRGLRLPAGKSRFHRWSENRRWPRPKGDNVSVAEPWLLEWHDIDMALAIFLDACNVDGALPPAPWEPRLL